MKEALKLWLLIAALIAGGFWLASRFVSPAPKKSLVIATGRKEGLYYDYALRYKQLLEREEVHVKLLETAGSIETRRLLLEHKADIGFMQGGTAHAKDGEHLKAIAAIYPEPLWIFVPAKSAISSINALVSKRIAIGEHGSGTFALSKTLLKSVGIDARNTALLDTNATEGYRLLKKGKIDALFDVIGTSSSRVYDYFAERKIKLLPLRRLDAFHLHFPYLERVTLPQGALDLAENLPRHDVALLASSAMVVATEGLDKVLVRLMARVVRNAPQPTTLLMTSLPYPNIRSAQLPIHPSAERYFEEGDSWLERIFPYWIAANIYRLKIMLIPILTLLIPLLKGFFPLYRWRIRARIFRWYDTLDSIDKEIDKMSPQELRRQIERLNALQKEIKTQTDVPLSYMSEYYLLRTHVAFILERLSRRLHQTANKEPS